MDDIITVLVLYSNFFSINFLHSLYHRCVHHGRCYQHQILRTPHLPATVVELAAGDGARELVVHGHVICKVPRPLHCCPCHQTWRSPPSWSPPACRMKPRQVATCAMTSRQRGGAPVHDDGDLRQLRALLRSRCPCGAQRLPYYTRCLRHSDAGNTQTAPHYACKGALYRLQVQEVYILLPW